MHFYVVVFLLFFSTIAPRWSFDMLYMFLCCRVYVCVFFLLFFVCPNDRLRRSFRYYAFLCCRCCMYTCFNFNDRPRRYFAMVHALLLFCVFFSNDHTQRSFDMTYAFHRCRYCIFAFCIFFVPTTASGCRLIWCMHL